MAATRAIGRTPAESEYPPALQAWITVAILLLLSLISVVDKNILSLLGETIRHDLDLTDKQLSLLFGPAFAISYAFGALPFGWAMDRYSRRLVLGLGVVIWSLGTLAAGLSASFAQLLGARATVGAGESVLVPGNQAILAESFPPSRLAFPYAISSTGVMLGQGLSFAIGGALIAAIGASALVELPVVGAVRGWQGILLLVGLPGLLFTSLVFLIPERHASQRTPAQADVGYRDYIAYARSRRRFFVVMHLGSILSVMIYSSLLAWTPAHFIRAYNLPASEVGMWLGVVVVAGPVTGQLLHGTISDWLFRRGMRDAHARHLAVTVGAATVPLVAAFAAPTPMLGFVLLGLGYGLFSAFGVLGPVVLQMMLPAELRGKAASGLTLVTGLAGMALGPTVVALISDGLFADPAKIGLALAVYAAVALPLAAFFYSLAMKPLAAAYSAETGEQ